MKIHLEIEINNQWEFAGSVTLLGKEKEGTTGACLLEYDSDYAFKYLSQSGCHAFSCRYPVNFAVEKISHWPAFLLDLMPSGAARRTLEKKLNIKNSKEFDWKLLEIGACNPIGNIRVKPNEQEILTNDEHPGFDLSQIIEKEEGFIEYALECGAPVSGTTGVAGDAPKFTLSKSKNGKWHPGGSLSKHLIDSEWIIKFLRGRTRADHVILESEALLYQLAETFGMRGGFKPSYRDHALLIPRFDTVRRDHHLQRIGVESLYSAMNVYEFGASMSQEQVIRTIQQFTTHPMIEIREYLIRDFYNYLIGNTDNHGRNTSFIKREDGPIELSPIYDCAPMKLDPQIITRSITWDEVQRNPQCHTLPDLTSLWCWFDQLGLDTHEFAVGIATFLERLKCINFDRDPWPEEMLVLLKKNRKTLLTAFP